MPLEKRLTSLSERTASHESSRHAAKVARPIDDLRFRHSVDDPVEHAREKTADDRFATARLTTCGDAIVVRVPVEELDHLGEQGRRILQVGVKRGHEIAIGRAQSRV